MRMFVEDLLARIQSSPIYTGTAWESKFLHSVYLHTLRGNALTTAQANTLLKIFWNLRSTIVSHRIMSQVDLDKLIKNPCYRQSPLPSRVIPKEARYLGNNIVGIRYKRDDEIVYDIKRLNLQYGMQVASWDSYNKLWVLEVNSSSVNAILNLLVTRNFACDDELIDFFDTFQSKIGEKASFTLGEDRIIANVPDSNIIRKWVDGMTFSSFELPATGNVARRLLKIARYNRNIVVDDLIKQLTYIDKIQTNAFMENSDEMKAAQELIDYDLRFVLPVPSMKLATDWSKIILASAKSIGIENVIMRQDSYTAWDFSNLKEANKTYGLNLVAWRSEIYEEDFNDNQELAHLYTQRDKTLLITYHQGTGGYGTLHHSVYEFPHTAVLCDPKSTTAFTIYPYLPRPEKMIGSAKLLRDSGFMQTGIHPLAGLYGIVTARLH